MEFTETACAKINLHLEVLGRRDDGYHNILSLMVSADECDLLQLEEFEISGENAPVNIRIFPRGGTHEWLMTTVPLQENLIVRAAKAYFAKAGTGGSVVIGVQKNIPAGAGLGGGSSDAAAMLRLLNSQMHCFSDKELLKLASTIGADVPYCLVGGYAICEGIGDIITPLEGRLRYWVLIVQKNLHISTRKAYEALGRKSQNSYPSVEIENKKKIFGDGLKKGDIGIFKEVLKNDFEKYAFRTFPELEGYKKQLYSYGADYAAMTGSGSSIVGIFKDYDALRRAEKSFLEQEIQVIVAQIV